VTTLEPAIEWSPTVEASALLILTRGQVATALEGAELLEPLAQALISYSRGEASAPPRVAAQAPGGWLGAMPAFVPGVALGAKLITVFPANAAANVPSHQGMVALFDGETGMPLCVIDAGLLTAVRTAAVSALSVRELARPGPWVLAILGSGEQARAHLELVPSVGGVSELRLAARNPVRAQEVADRVPGCRVFASFESAVRGADVVLCCTDSPDPVLRRSWLGPGVHVVSVGMGSELDRETVRQGRLFVEWMGALSSPPPAGARELQGLDPGAATELGDVLTRSGRGRRSDEELTVFKSTGLGVEDVAVAQAVYQAARLRGLGVELAW